LLALDGVELTGQPEQRLPNNVSVIVDGVEGGDLVAALDLEGIEVSTGSACTSGSTEPSHVLLAMGVEPHAAHGSLRLTLGPDTTGEQVATTLDVMRRLLPRLRGSGSIGPVAAVGA
jgi:cysteine desulfurase